MNASAQQVRVDAEVRAESGRDAGDDVAVVAARPRAAERQSAWPNVRAGLRARRPVRHGSTLRGHPRWRGRAVGRTMHRMDPGRAARPVRRSPRPDLRPAGRPGRRRRLRLRRARSTTCAAAGTIGCSAASRRASRATYGWDVTLVRLGVRRRRLARLRHPRVRRRVDRDPARSRRRSRTRAARAGRARRARAAWASACCGSAAGSSRAAATSSARVAARARRRRDRSARAALGIKRTRRPRRPGRRRP